jgi:hypothetical protein
VRCENDSRHRPGTFRADFLDVGHLPRVAIGLIDQANTRHRKDARPRLEHVFVGTVDDLEVTTSSSPSAFTIFFLSMVMLPGPGNLAAQLPLSHCRTMHDRDLVALSEIRGQGWRRSQEGTVGHQRQSDHD